MNIARTINKKCRPHANVPPKRCCISSKCTTVSRCGRDAPFEINKSSSASSRCLINIKSFNGTTNLDGDLIGDLISSGEQCLDVSTSTRGCSCINIKNQTNGILAINIDADKNLIAINFD